MTVRSIIDVELNDDKFKAFAALFEKYSATLAKTPGAWAAAGKEIQGSRKGFEAIAAAMLAQNEMTRRAATEQRKNVNELDRASTLWRSMARSTSNVAGNIRAMTGQLLKWASITGIVSGLVGAGGLFGIDRLALGVASGRRSSLGLGTGYGEQRAFQTNFGRLIDPDTLLSGVSTALAGNRTALFGAGLSGNQLQGSTAQVSVEVLKSVKRLVDRTDESQLGFVANARRLGELGFGVEDLRRLKRTSAGEFQGLIGQYGANRGEFDLPRDVSRRWQEFTTQMSRAGQGIENTFVRGLAPLAPGLTKLSESFEKVVKAFLLSPTLEKWITALDVGLEKLAKYIGTPEFEKNVRDFAVNLGNAAVAVGQFAAWVVGKSPEGATTGGLLGEKEGHDTWNEMLRGSRILRDRRAAGTDTLGGQFLGSLTGANLLGIVRRSEGSGDQAVSPAGAVGRYQIEPGTARQYGFDPSRLKDPAYNETVAKTILADLVRRYHGNTNEILAAYNAGPGVANRYRASGDNAGVLPRETQKYIDRAQHMQGYTPIVVSVENNTGGNAAVSVNGLKN
jgi:hypothetical protein